MGRVAGPKRSESLLPAHRTLVHHRRFHDCKSCFIALFASKIPHDSSAKISRSGSAHSCQPTALWFTVGDFMIVSQNAHTDTRTFIDLPSFLHDNCRLN